MFNTLKHFTCQFFNLQEAFTHQSVNTLEIVIKDKMDRDEIKQLHTYIDTRFKNFKPKVQETRMSEDNAAASRKQLLKNCNCISCDRPVDLPITEESKLPRGRG